MTKFGDVFVRTGGFGAFGFGAINVVAIARMPKEDSKGDEAWLVMDLDPTKEVPPIFRTWPESRHLGYERVDETG